MKNLAAAIVLSVACILGVAAQELTVQTMQESLRLFQSGNYRAVIEFLAPLNRPENADNPLYHYVLQHMGYSAYYTGNYSLAIDSLVKLKDIQERTLGREHPSYATTFYYLGASYQAMGDYGLAESLYLEAKTIWEKTLGREHPSYASTLNNLGEIYRAMGDYSRAESSHLEAKSIREKTLGKEHPEYATTLNNLGGLYQAMGDHDRAERSYLETKTILEKTLGKEHPSYATTLSNLGELYRAIGDYSRAESFYLEAKAIRETTLGKEHPDYATTLNNLGALYWTMGDYGRAESSLLEVKAVFEKTLGREHPSYATALNNLGNLYQDMGDYGRAESSLLEVKAVFEKTLGREHPSYATALNNLGSLYKAMGDYGRAESFHREAKTIWETALGKEHPDYATTLNNLGALYWTMGDYSQAESSLLEVKAVFETALGKEHPDYATTLNNLGALYWTMGDYGRAESSLLEVKAVFETALGKEHPDYATTLNNLGELYRAMGDYGRAERSYLEAKTIFEKILGREHPSYALSISNMSRLYQDMRNYPQAVELKQENSQLQINQVNRNFAFLSARQRDSYWNSISFDFVHGYSLSHFQPGVTVNGLNYDNTLFSRGLLLRTTNAVRQAVYASGNTSLITQYEELGRLRRQIQNLRQSDGNRDYIGTLETQAEELDKSLSRDSAAYRDLQADLAITWQTVQAALNKDEAAIEFVSFRLYDKTWTDTTLYAALVLRPGMAAPAWVPLCNESQIQAQLARVQGRSSAEQARILYSTFGPQLYALIWQPLETELQGVQRIYYSPAGLLHKLSFAALPVEGDRLADKYDLNLVSSTRELVKGSEGTTGSRPGKAVVYGGLKYGGDKEEDRQEMALAAKTYRDRRELADLPGSMISQAPPETTRGGAWDTLPASREESRLIHSYLTEGGIPCALFQDAAGNEESFKALDREGTGVIHLATHGYFLEDIQSEGEEEERDLVRRLGGGQRGTEENPLLQSGLLLAGGNHAWTRKPVEGEGIEDGILTAAEIADMNLLGAELVVLSACETGLGEVKNGEGVFGLQRAFKLAGVQTLIMSLWEVADEATMKLMEEFYRRWLGGEGKEEAFKGAQWAVRDTYPDPYFWAAFVLMD